MGAPAERGDDPRVGTTVASRYFLHRLLGRGGMGDVYEATRLEDERRVAVKLLRAGPDRERLRRFEREAALAARLSNPGCVEVLELGDDPAAGHFLAMELVRGRDLARVLGDEGPLAPARAARVADGVLAVLAAAHAAGVIHRDLKPANVMLEEAGGPERVKVLDFGIATFLDPAPGERPLTTEGATYGTPAYMSPEQLRGQPLDARSDLYAVGVLLFEMLADATPFQAPTAIAVAARQLTEIAPRLEARRADVPPALAELVARALDRDPARRPASAEEMREALRAAVPAGGGGRSVTPRPLPATEGFPTVQAPAPAQVAARSAWDRRAVWGGMAVLVGAAVAVAVMRGRGAGAAAIPTATSTSTSTATPPATATPTATPTPTPTSTSTSKTAAAPAPTDRRSDRPALSSARPLPSTSTSTSTTTTTTTPSSAVAAAHEPADAVEPRPAIRVVGAALDAVPTPAVDSGDGVLVLQAAPWAIVSVAGVSLGETPREVRLAAGSYDVRGVHPELGERTGRVEVRAGERARWSVTFER